MGEKRQKTGGRQKGTPNKATAKVKQAIADFLEEYMNPDENGVTKLKEDLDNMLPEDRVRAVTQLAAFVIPKQQALSIEETAQAEKEGLIEFLETAPDEAIDRISERVVELSAAAEAV